MSSGKSNTRTALSHTQPLCDECWALENPHREPVRIVDTQGETCCYCGRVTEAGIYIRVRDPNAVAYPSIY